VSFYERRILPHLINFACGTDLITRQRQKLIPFARGLVLEIGFGSGLNLPFYDRTRVSKLLGVEPSEELREMARRKADLLLPLEFIGLSAEAISLSDKSVDTVVSTYTLCTIPDVVSALQEIRRVLKPDGVLLFSEHGRAPDPGVRRWQDRVNPLWRPLAGGCNLNRDVPGLLHAAGFKLDRLEQGYLPGPRLMTFNSAGSARPG
jgi:ubiquinone/menaquinone biosynthesis C-methylase UbiE